MYVLIGQAELFLPYSSSLKDKRQTIQSIIQRLRKRFSISMAEVDHNDLWQRSALGFAAVCKTSAESDLILNTIVSTLDMYTDACEITKLNWEIISP